MLRVKRDGRELVIAESDLTEHLKMGYSVIDGKGNELTRSQAITYEQAIKENSSLKDRLKKAAISVERLQSQNVELKKKLKMAEAKGKTI